MRVAAEEAARREEIAIRRNMTREFNAAIRAEQYALEAATPVEPIEMQVPVDSPELMRLTGEPGLSAVDRYALELTLRNRQIAERELLRVRQLLANPSLRRVGRPFSIQASFGSGGPTVLTQLIRHFVRNGTLTLAEQEQLINDGLVSAEQIRIWRGVTREEAARLLEWWIENGSRPTIMGTEQAAKELALLVADAIEQNGERGTAVLLRRAVAGEKFTNGGGSFAIGRIKVTLRRLRRPPIEASFNPLSAVANIWRRLRQPGGLLAGTSEAARRLLLTKIGLKLGLSRPIPMGPPLTAEQQRIALENEAEGARLTQSVRGASWRRGGTREP